MNAISANKIFLMGQLKRAKEDGMNNRYYHVVTVMGGDRKFVNDFVCDVASRMNMECEILGVDSGVYRVAFTPMEACNANGSKEG